MAVTNHSITSNLTPQYGNTRLQALYATIVSSCVKQLYEYLIFLFTSEMSFTGLFNRRIVIRHVRGAIIQYFLFVFVRGLSVCSDHCRAMECRIWVTTILGEMNVARVKQS